MKIILKIFCFIPLIYIIFFWMCIIGMFLPKNIEPYIFCVVSLLLMYIYGYLLSLDKNLIPIIIGCLVCYYCFYIGEDFIGLLAYSAELLLIHMFVANVYIIIKKCIKNIKQSSRQ